MSKSSLVPHHDYEEEEKGDVESGSAYGAAGLLGTDCGVGLLDGGSLLGSGRFLVGGSASFLLGAGGLLGGELLGGGHLLGGLKLLLGDRPHFGGSRILGGSASGFVDEGVPGLIVVVLTQGSQASLLPS